MKDTKKEFVLNRLKGVKAMLVALSECGSGIKDVEYSLDILSQNLEEVIFEIEDEA